jgi:uncharacterized membrane protein YgcG
MASVIVKFEGERFQTLLLRTSLDLPDHVVGEAYWVPFGNEARSAYHIKDVSGNKFPVELINGQWYQLTWGMSGYRTSPSSIITPQIRVELGLGWYQPGDPEYKAMIIGSIMKQKGRETNLHSPREHQQIEEESTEEEESLRGIQVEESLVEPMKRVSTPMPGEWKINLGERIQSRQIKEMVKITDKDFSNPLPDPGLFPEASAITFSEAMRNIDEDPPPPSPLVSAAAIGALSGTATIFQPQPTFGQTSLAKVATTTTKVFHPQHPAFIRPKSTAARYTAIPQGGSGYQTAMGGTGSTHSSGGPGGPGGGSSGPGSPGGGGGGPRGPGSGGRPPQPPQNVPQGGGHHGSNSMKGNAPTVFTGDRTKSDKFLREF